ncbi:MAG: hypothetical protein RMJ60_05155 [Anaerolineales bacterium]|nr:hypothetical protein [Anaerolineales bacterium]
MAFEVQDFLDLVTLLHRHPEWQEELRRLVLTREVLELPEIVRELAEAQKRTEQRVEELAEAQKRSEERLTRLEQVVAELAEAQKRTEEELHALTRRVDGLTGEVGNLRGDMLEMQYRQRAFSFFGKIVSRLKVVDLQEVWEELEAHLSEEELDKLLELDLLLAGRLKAAWAARSGSDEVWLAVEISAVVDRQDVERAWERAALLRRAGLPVLAVAAGHRWTQGAEQVAEHKGVVLQKDGQIKFVEQALRMAKE